MDNVNTFFISFTEQEGLELESSLKSGFSGDAMFVKCDVKKEADIKVLKRMMLLISY